ncbi:MAG: nucleotide exchange factor GrpE [Candidatus Sungbacteria bacterium]|nr:nucleotide exchange factor GrpE [Candidatus Sungbacteria bacterium]
MPENSQNNNISAVDAKENSEDGNIILAKCEKEKKEYLEGWQRAKADHINYRKDEAKRFEDMARFVTAGLLQDVLPVLDSFELAFRSSPLSSSGFQQNDERGMLLIRSQLLDLLKKRGLEEIKVNAGNTFDPEMHESIGEIESEHASGSIAEEVQKGYYFMGKVLRPARVRLAKSK